MKKIISLIILSSLNSHFYSQEEIYTRALDFVLNDVKNRLPKKSKVYFSGVIYSNGESGFIRSNLNGLVVDTTGFTAANESLQLVAKDSVWTINYKSDYLRKRKFRKSFELVVYKTLDYNQSATFLRIIVQNDYLYIYNLFIDENNIDCVFNTFID